MLALSWHCKRVIHLLQPQEKETTLHNAPHDHSHVWLPCGTIIQASRFSWMRLKRTQGAGTECVMQQSGAVMAGPATGTALHFNGM